MFDGFDHSLVVPQMDISQRHTSQITQIQHTFMLYCNATIVGYALNQEIAGYKQCASIRGHRPPENIEY